MKATLLLSSILVLFFSAKGAQAQEQDAGAVRFAVIGDFGSGDHNERAVANLIDSWDVDFVITTGDNYYLAARGFGGNGFNQYDNSVGKFYCVYLKDIALPDWGTLDCPPQQQSQTLNRFFPAIGNHDRTDTQRPGVSTYLDYFTLPGDGFQSSSGSERYYDFVQGPIHFFAIDSDTARRDENDMLAQQTWLRDQLQASSSPWQIVYFHQPAYSSSLHGSDPTMQWPFAEWGADAVFQGHDHVYERILADDIVYFVTGNGGKDLYEFDPAVPGSAIRYDAGHGAVLVTATAEAIDFEAWAIDDQRQDTLFTTPVLVDLYHLPRVQKECAVIEEAICVTPPSIGGNVWVDGNENGRHDPDEHLRAGFPVNLWDPGVDGQIGGDDDKLVARTRSGNQGYGFYDVAPGDYFVTFEISDRFSPSSAAQDNDLEAGTRSTEVFMYDGDHPRTIDASVIPDPPAIEAPLLASPTAVLSTTWPWILFLILAFALLAIGVFVYWKRRARDPSRP